MISCKPGDIIVWKHLTLGHLEFGDRCKIVAMWQPYLYSDKRICAVRIESGLDKGLIKTIYMRHIPLISKIIKNKVAH